MTKITTASLLFLAAGILTSVSLLSIYQVLFSIPLCYYTYLALKNKNFELPRSAYWLLAFTAVALLSLVVNFELIPKPSKNFGRLKYFIFGACGIFALRVWVADASEKTKRILVNIFLLSVIIAGIASFITMFTRVDGRARGFTDTMRYGYGSGMLLLTILSGILHREKLKFFDARLGIVAFIIGFIGMYVTFTRGALLGFLCGLPFVIYFYRAKYGLYFGGFAIAVLGVLGGFYLFGNVQQGSGPRILVSKNNPSDNIRRSQWKAAIIATQEKPVLGWGFSNFHSQLKRIKNDYDLDAKDYNDAHAHNLFLEIAAGTGLLGLCVFLVWIGTWAWEVFHQDLLTKALVIPFCVAWIVSSQFEVTFDANNAVMIFFLYSVSSMNLSRSPRSEG
jgi:O-antigen ligase